MPDSKRRVFEKRTVYKTTLDKLNAFHQDRAALSKLTPPPIFIQLHQDGRTSLTEGDLEFTLWFGPLPIRWLARHEAPPAGLHGFIEWQVKGPLKFWRHEHLFEPVEGGVALHDRVTLEHQAGWKGVLTRLMFDGLPLQFLFFYRHWRTRQAVERG
jgi:ligand-binding SRPBCC domain-containing protein